MASRGIELGSVFLHGRARERESGVGFGVRCFGELLLFPFSGLIGASMSSQPDLILLPLLIQCLFFNDHLKYEFEENNAPES